jgi:hypothetical protein
MYGVDGNQAPCAHVGLPTKLPVLFGIVSNVKYEEGPGLINVNKVAPEIVSP